MAPSITHEEFALAFGFDSTATWKDLSIGIFTSSQKHKLDVLLHRRTSMPRIEMMALSWKLAARFMPDLVRAYMKELNAFSNNPNYQQPTTIEGPPFGSLFNQLYCSSYYHLWAREGGPLVDEFVRCCFAYVLKMRVSDFNDWRLTNRDNILFEIFSYLIVNVPHNRILSLNLFPSSNEPAVRQTTKFLPSAIAFAQKNQHDINAQFSIPSIQAVEDFIQSRGRVKMHPQFQGESWGMCAGGSLNACEEEREEKLGACARCRSVMYCGQAHQKDHWKGRGTIPMTWTHKELCFEPGF